MEPGFLILYEEGPCLVVCKPAGVLTQAPPGIDSLERRQGVLRGRPTAGRAVPGRAAPPGPPGHRGHPLWHGRRATRKLGRQFEFRKVRKVYWACVPGPIVPEAGIWEDWVRKIHGEPRAEVVAPGHPQGPPGRATLSTF